MNQLRKLGLVSVAMSLVALSACGGGGGDDAVDSGLTIVDSGRRDTGATTDGTVNTPDSSTTGACNPVTNTGCASPMKCSLSGPTTLGCGTAGTGMQGATCTDDSMCAASFVCLTTGKCHRFCDQTTQCPMDGTMPTRCNIGIGQQGQPPVASACGPFTTCDILAQDCPTTTDGCFLTQTGGECAPPGTVADGTACSNANSCMKGSVCVSTVSGAAAKCTKVCRVAGGAPTCSTGTCTALGGLPTGAGLCQ